MRLDYFLISLVVFSAMVVTFVSFIGDVNNTYEVNIGTSEYGDVYNTINETYELSQDVQDKADLQLSGTDTANSMFLGSFSAMRLVWNAQSSFIAIINAIASALGIPSYWIIVAVTVMSIVIAFSIIYLVLRLIQ